MSVEQIVAIAGAIVTAQAIAIGVLWRALIKSQEARIEAAQRHEKDLETIMQGLRRKKGGSP
jgi:hypothetical protein